MNLWEKPSKQICQKHFDYFFNNRMKFFSHFRWSGDNSRYDRSSASLSNVVQTDVDDNNNDDDYNDKTRQNSKWKPSPPQSKKNVRKQENIFGQQKNEGFQYYLDFFFK